MKTLAAFFSLSLLASLLQYLFQVQLARSLGQEAFAAFTGEWARFSLLLVIGGILQIWSSLRRLTPTRFKTWWLIANMIVLTVFILSLLLNHLWLSQFAAILAAGSLGLLLGHHLGHGHHYTVALASVLNGCLKLGGLFLIPLPTHLLWPLITVSYLVPQVIHCFATETDAAPEAGHAFTAAICLALAVHLFPQMDGLWAGYSSEFLSVIAPLTLVTKAVFYFQIIFAQWWLPSQGKGFSFQLKPILAITLTLLGMLLAITFIGPQILSTFLGWQTTAGRELFFLVALQAGILGLCYQAMQLSLLRQQLTVAWALVSCLTLSWLVVAYIATTPTHYYAILVGVQMLFLAAWSRIESRRVVA